MYWGLNSDEARKNGAVAVLIEPKGFWEHIEPVLGLASANAIRNRQFELTHSTPQFRVTTQRQNYRIKAKHHPKNTCRYWVQIFDESVEKDCLGNPLKGQNYMVREKSVDSFEEAIILHYSTLNYLQMHGSAAAGSKTL
jgi:hypothetical protein